MELQIALWTSNPQLMLTNMYDIHVGHFLLPPNSFNLVGEGDLLVPKYAFGKRGKTYLSNEKSAAPDN